MGCAIKSLRNVLLRGLTPLSLSQIGNGILRVASHVVHDLSAEDEGGKVHGRLGLPPPCPLPKLARLSENGDWEVGGRRHKHRVLSQPVLAPTPALAKSW